LKPGAMIGPTSGKNRSTFDGDLVPDIYRLRITFKVLSPLQNRRLRRLLAFLTQSPATWHETRPNDRMNPLTFWQTSNGEADPDPDQSVNPYSNSVCS